MSTGNPHNNFPPPPGQQPPFGGNQPGGYGPGYGAGSGPAYSSSGPANAYPGSTPQPAPAPGYHGQQGGAPAKKKSKLPLFLSLGAVLLVIVLVAVGAIVINVVNKNQYGPDKVAEEYLQNIQDGKIAEANKLAKPTVPEGASDALLDPKYAAKSSEKITGAKVDRTDIKGDSATIEASYTLGGQQYKLPLKAKKTGKQGLFFDKWELTGPVLQTIAVDLPALDGATVNGEGFTSDGGRTEYAVMPGNYEFKLPGGKYVKEASDQITVGFSDTDTPTAADLSLPLTATDAYQDEVTKLVRDKVTECAKDTSITPKCKFLGDASGAVDRSGKSISKNLKEDGATYTIVSQPTIKASLGGDGAVGSFYTSSDGRMNLRIDAKGGGVKYYFKNNVPFRVSGSVKIEGDKLSIELF